ncbi:MAG: hypothetical protein AAF545_15325 [Pseudomonadota bacterium]
MSNPTPSDVHVDSALTSISIAFIQNSTSFVSHRVFPTLTVQKQSDRYFIFNRGDFHRDQAEVRAPGTEAATGSYDLDNTPTYFANVKAFRQLIPDEVRANADAAADPDRAAAEYVLNKMMLARETSWVANNFTTGVWGNDVTPTNLWDTASSTPIEDVETGITQIMQDTGYKPNKLTISRPVYAALRNNPGIVDRIKFSGAVGPNNAAIVNLQTMAQVFDVEEVLVANAVVNIAAEGAAPVNSFIAGNNALLSYAPRSPSLLTPSAGYTFAWSGVFGAQNEMGIAVMNYRLREGRHSDVVEGHLAVDQKLVAAECGYFFSGVVS